LGPLLRIKVSYGHSAHHISIKAHATFGTSYILLPSPFVCMSRVGLGSLRFASIRFGSIRFASIRFDSIRLVRLASIRFDSVGSTRFDSIRFDSIRFGFDLIRFRFDSVRFGFDSVRFDSPLVPYPSLLFRALERRLLAAIPHCCFMPVRIGSMPFPCAQASSIARCDSTSLSDVGAYRFDALIASHGLVDST
jgi:hypothetical protein